MKLIQLPPPTVEIGQSPAWRALLKRLLSVSIRVHSKGNSKTWMVEFVFYSTPLPSTHPKEQGKLIITLIKKFTSLLFTFFKILNKLLQITIYLIIGSRRPVYFQYDMGSVDTIARNVDSLLNDWSQIVHLYTIVHDLSEYLNLSSEKYNLSNIFSVKSYNYSKLVLCYGPDKGAMISITWNAMEKVFKLAFGANNNSLNAHSIIREQLECHLNRHRNLAQIVQLLHETYEPLISISKLPSIPQLGVYNAVSNFKNKYIFKKDALNLLRFVFFFWAIVPTFCTS